MEGSCWILYSTSTLTRTLIVTLGKSETYKETIKEKSTILPYSIHKRILLLVLVRARLITTRMGIELIITNENLGPNYLYTVLYEYSEDTVR